MRLITLAVLCVALSFAAPAALLAESGQPTEKEMTMKMLFEMMGGFHDKLVPTSDGGVVLFVGDKLMKYDRNLNLVNEVKVEFPKGPMGPGSGHPFKDAQDAQKR